MPFILKYHIYSRWFQSRTPPSLIVPAAAVKLPGEYLFGYLDSGCRVFCVGNVITPSLIPHLDRDVNPNRRLLLPRLKSSDSQSSAQLHWGRITHVSFCIFLAHRNPSRFRNGQTRRFHRKKPDIVNPNIQKDICSHRIRTCSQRTRLTRIALRGRPAGWRAGGRAWLAGSLAGRRAGLAGFYNIKN